MSQTIKVPNFNSSNIVERTVLAAAHEAAAALLTVENSDKCAAPYLAYVGHLGTETAEIAELNAIIDETSASLLTPLVRDHDDQEPVTILFAGQISIYRAPNVDGTAPAVASFTLLQTVDIDPDDMATTYTDAAGGSDYWYRFTYNNGASETNLADSPAVRGGNTNIYCSIEQIRQAAGFENAPYITDQMIATHRGTAQSKIDGALNGLYTVPFTDPINPQVQAIAAQFAAGYLLLDQYPNNPDRGNAKVKWAEAELEKIVDGETELLDSAGTSLKIAVNTDGAGYPDATTQYEPGEDRLFRISDVSNDYDRKY